MVSILRNRSLTRRVAPVLAMLPLILCAGSGAADAKTYTADRFDSVIRLLPDGAIEVTETVVFRFEDGTFTYVFREIPTRRTDGVEVVAAGMDERSLPFGDGPDQVEIRQRGRVRVTWRFAPTSVSTHTFTLRYLVRGVVAREDRFDVLRWQALPSEHAYAIASSTIELTSPVPVSAEPDLDSRRVEDTSVTVDGQRVRISARQIGKNGWVQLAARFPSTSIVAAPPRWQERQLHARALAPRWAMGAVAVGMAGLLLLLAIRQRYDAPRRERLSGAVIDAPDQLSPVMAGVLASNGRVGAQHAMASLMSLADRGHLTIAEGARRLGQRTFTVSRGRSSGTIAPHERTLLEIIFTDKRGRQDTVEFSKARGRLTRHFRQFRDAVEQELITGGLIDPERHRIYRLYGRVSIVLLVCAGALVAPIAFLVQRYGPWPLMIPGAVAAAAILGFIFQGATTPLSNEGARRRERWLAYQKHLNEVAHSKAHLRVDSPAHVLPIAVALGLATAWSKLLKQHPTAAPAWFHSFSTAGDESSFPAFIAAGAAHGHGAGASGGAAGGGASGAG